MVTNSQLVVAVIAVGTWCGGWLVVSLILAIRNRKAPK